MTLNEYKREIRHYFQAKHDVRVSNTAMRAFTKDKYLNHESLKSMPEEEVMEVMQPIFDDVLKSYVKRKERSRREVLLRDVDVLPVMVSAFCKLPPICGRKYVR
ncbi:MAG: hypothetical protein AAGI37_16895 [Planctomycetota bacterium]